MFSLFSLSSYSLNCLYVNNIYIVLYVLFGLQLYIIAAYLTSDRPSRECPSPSRVVDLVVGTCAATVLGDRMSPDSDPCL